MAEREVDRGAGSATARGTGAAVRDSRATMRAEVAAGLRAAQKTLPSKYFYDTRGSELFEEITRLPEYYLTRTERGLLEQWAPALASIAAPRTLAELGAGSATKTRLLLDAMRERAAEDGHGVAYLPMDVSEEFLESTAVALQSDYPDLVVRPLVADMTRPLPIPHDIDRPVLMALLGSTIGNFDPAESVALFARVRAVLGAGDHFLVGADLRKDPAELVAAYADSRGVTAAFNRNVLHVLNRELGANFDPKSYVHRALYTGGPLHRIEMHLVATAPQVVDIPRVGAIRIAEGESIRTEISCKYDRATMAACGEAAGFRLARWITDDAARFALALFSPAA